MAQGQLGRLAYIDGWRVIAVACVILAHASLTPEIGAFFKTSFTGALSEYGEVGVLIFFFISGYVVSSTCLNETNKRKDFSAPAFYVRRICRIIPPLSLYLFTCWLLGVFKYIDFSTINLISSSLYICNTSISDCGWYGGHTWSLAFEEQFYLFFPFAFSYIELRKKPNIAALIFIIVITLLPFIFSVFWIGKTGFIIIHSLFWAGYLCAKYSINIINAVSVFRFNNIIFALSIFIVFMPTGTLSASSNYDMHLFFIKYYKFLYVAAIPAMVMFSGNTGTFFHYLLSNKYISNLGRVTYSIYLWQQLFTGPLFRNAGVYIQLSSIFLMILFCVLLFDLVELKCIKFGVGISNRLKHHSDLTTKKRGTSLANTITGAN